MADELDLKDDSPEVAADEPGVLEAKEPGQSAVSETRIAKLGGLVAQKDEELARVNARVNELEQAITSKDGDIAALTQSKDGLEERLTALSNSLVEAIASYKAMVIQANPGVVEELINGDTIESINESVSQAKTLVSKVRQGVEAEISLARVPAGAPERTSPDLSALSPREKIQYAIGGRR